MRLLIIDDSKTMRTFLAYLAKELSIETAEAYDGQNALEVLAQSPPFDLALVDWDMPRMTGFQFVQAVRQNPAYADLKLMMVTTQNTMEKIGAALEAGANDFLMKPVTKEALEEKLQILGLAA